MTTLTMQDEKRLEIIQRVLHRELTVMQAALVMGGNMARVARSVWQ